MSDSIRGQAEMKEHAMQVFLLHYDYVQYVALIHAPAEHLQEDIVNDAFIDFIRKANHWDYTSDIRPLLRGITENIAKQYWRNYLKTLPSQMRKLSEHFVQFTREKMEREIEDNEDIADKLQAQKHCLQKLPQQSRELIEAFYYKGKTLSAIARETRRNYGTLCKAMMRIRNGLRKCIENFLKGDRNSV